MALPDTLTQVWIVGTLHREDGSAVRGRVTFLPSTASLTNQTTDDTYSLSAPFSGVLDVDGYFEVKVPTTDAPGFQPSGWTYTVREPLRRAYPIAVPAATPVLSSPGHPLHGQRVLDLSDVVPLPAPSSGSVQIVAPPAASPEEIAAVVEGYLDDHPPVGELGAQVDAIETEQEAHHIRLDTLEVSNDELSARIAALTTLINDLINHTVPATALYPRIGLYPRVGLYPRGA